MPFAGHSSKKRSGKKKVSLVACAKAWRGMKRRHPKKTARKGAYRAFTKKCMGGKVRLSRRGKKK